MQNYSLVTKENTMVVLRLISLPVILAFYLVLAVLMVVTGAFMWVASGDTKITIPFPAWR